MASLRQLRPQNRRELGHRCKKVPLRLRPAVDVTAAEYQKAKRSRLLLWLTTAVGIGLGFFSILTGTFIISLPILGIFSTPIIFGVIAHLVASLLFRDAKKMASTRMQLYPALIDYQEAQKKSNQDSSD